jgi:DNA-binding NarL/FixJ family response regulator
MAEEFLASTKTTSQPLVGQPLLIVSEVRLLREGIAKVIEGQSSLWVAGLCGNLSEALAKIGERPWVTVLLDASFPNGLDAVRAIHAIDPAAFVVVFAVSETEENIVAWAKAGAVGYIPTTAALRELAGFIESIIRGEQICSAGIASRLMRRLGSDPALGDDRNSSRPMFSLTAREHEIIHMIAEGLSNKEIARRLHIELSTTKSHVHNLLGKLGLQRRGQVAHWALSRESRPG